MYTATDFRAAIVANYDEDTHRLAYADWLEENDIDPVRARFIRIQCRLARLPVDDPLRDSLTREAKSLFSAADPAELKKIIAQYPKEYKGVSDYLNKLAELCSLSSPERFALLTEINEMRPQLEQQYNITLPRDHPTRGEAWLREDYGDLLKNPSSIGVDSSYENFSRGFLMRAFVSLPRSTSYPSQLTDCMARIVTLNFGSERISANDIQDNYLQVPQGIDIAITGLPVAAGTWEIVESIGNSPAFSRLRELDFIMGGALSEEQLARLGTMPNFQNMHRIVFSPEMSDGQIRVLLDSPAFANTQFMYIPPSSFDIQMPGQYLILDTMLDEHNSKIKKPGVNVAPKSGSGGLGAE